MLRYYLLKKLLLLKQQIIIISIIIIIKIEKVVHSQHLRRMACSDGLTAGIATAIAARVTSQLSPPSLSNSCKTWRTRVRTDTPCSCNTNTTVELFKIFFFFGVRTDRETQFWKSRMEPEGMLISTNTSPSPLA